MKAALICLMLLSMSTCSFATLRCTNACLQFFGEGRRECLGCLDSFFDIAPLPISFLKDILAMRSNGFAPQLCNTRKNYPNEGVDMEKYPSGWKKLDSGNFTGCEKTSDYPGLGTTTYSSHAVVSEELYNLPSRQEYGEVWRGNERGVFITNAMFWSNVNPRSNLLGHSPKQHKVVRPVMEQAWRCDRECAESLFESAEDFLDSVDKLNVQRDIKAWVFRELFKRAFPGSSNSIDSQEFVDIQTDFVDIQPIAQILPRLLVKTITIKLRRRTQELYNKLRSFVAKHYGDQLENQDCSPTPNCIDQQTSAFMDIFLGAGGLSVPSAISTALWVVYGDSEQHGDVFPRNLRIDNENPLPLYFESMRFFAPVEAVTYWNPFPQRAFDDRDRASQYEGGERHILMLALANKDPNVWGEDGHKFRVRPISDYHRFFVGFADPARDDSVAEGKMNRNCPGKDLALRLGEAFLRAFDQERWVVDGEQLPREYTDFSPYVDEFALKKVN